MWDAEGSPLGDVAKIVIVTHVLAPSLRSKQAGLVTTGFYQVAEQWAN